MSVVNSAVATVQFSSVVRPDEFWARLTIQPRQGGQPMGVSTECNTTVKVSKDYAQAAELPLEELHIPACPMPDGADSLRVKVRAQIGDPAASGTVTVHEVSFNHDTV